jgi:hypothetical protein
VGRARRAISRAADLDHRAPEDFSAEESPVEVIVYAVGTAPITDEEATV